MESEPKEPENTNDKEVEVEEMLNIPKKTPKEVQPNLAAMDVETGNDSGERTKSEDTPVEGEKKEN